jgi:hypothetical protein
MSTRGPNTTVIAENSYPVRVRVFIPKGGSSEWSRRYDAIRAWLNTNCRGRHWVDSYRALGRDDGMLIYLPSAEDAAALVSEVGLTDLVQCRRDSSAPSFVYNGD